MVLLMKNISGSEGSHRETILSWLVWLVVPSMRYIGSPYMEQIITLVISVGTRVPFKSIGVSDCLTWRWGT